MHWGLTEREGSEWTGKSLAVTLKLPPQPPEASFCSRSKVKTYVPSCTTRAALPVVPPHPDLLQEHLPKLDAMTCTHEVLMCMREGSADESGTSDTLLTLSQYTPRCHDVPARDQGRHHSLSVALFPVNVSVTQ